MKPLSDHLASATQRNITVMMRLLVHLKEKIRHNKCSYLSHRKRVMWLQNATKSSYKRTLHSRVREKPPRPAVWWPWWVRAEWRPCAETHRLPGWSWDWVSGGLCLHTCWGGRCSGDRSAGRADSKQQKKTKQIFTIIVRYLQPWLEI